MKKFHGTADEYRDYIEQNAEIINTAIPSVLWWKNCDLRYFGVTQSFLASSNLKNSKEIEGRCDQELPWHQAADNFQEINQDIIKNKQPKTIISPNQEIAGESFTLFSSLHPIVDSDNEVIAIVGSSNIIDNKELVKAASELENQNYKTQGIGGTPFTFIDCYVLNGQQLTSKESICLFYTLRGKTAKQTATILSRSQRTVEIHLEKIKAKFNVSSKSELITTAIEAGFMTLIPSGIPLKTLNAVL